jgi:hypothetical protein
MSEEREGMEAKVRVEIRISRPLYDRLRQEATVCEESLNAYILMIIGHRKRVKVNVPSEKGYYIGY